MPRRVQKLRELALEAGLDIETAMIALLDAGLDIRSSYPFGEPRR
jgi:hypothetical protein